MPVQLPLPLTHCLHKLMVQVLDQTDQDIEAALERFQRERHPEVLALHAMDWEVADR